MAGRLEGKVAIVTGGSRGIGEAIARAFVTEGAKVVVASRKLEGLSAVADSLGPSAAAIAAHTGKEDDCRALVAQTIERFGRVDVLVNNAATNPYFGPLIDTPDAAIDKTFEVNVRGYLYGARALVRHARERKGPASIVNIASVAGLRAAPMQGIYGATKAAVISKTQTLAFELGGSNIRVNAIAPGWIATDISRHGRENPEFNAKLMMRLPNKRWADADELAGTAVFLASPAAGLINGVTIPVDGGYVAA